MTLTTVFSAIVPLKKIKSSPLHSKGLLFQKTTYSPVALSKCWSKTLSKFKAPGGLLNFFYILIRSIFIFSAMLFYFFLLATPLLATQNVLQMQIQRNSSIEAQLQLRDLIKAFGRGSNELSDYFDNYYIGKVSLGTPSKQFYKKGKTAYFIYNFFKTL